ncbi:DNA circularization protein [Desulfonatronovibrio hydrogenovorans]|uniref:DNA circularization protein n=1 Tax=Desulfonatronovibrio hydrogenovorans TaxID=53245 RepID=UPI00048E5540|nr:DNA circularization N-terminal domain-containing protein [Desulfonatronovibrio hydrogenovorans]
MSWKDRINEALRGSFRGTGFYVQRADTEGGRRTVVHEYPRRDRPYAEDLGRKARAWRIEAFVIGPDYDLDRDELIEALEQPGPGELVHPYLGTFQAVVTSARWNESTRDGGMCRFQIDFVEAGEAELPRTTVDTRGLALEAAEEAEAVIQADFEEEWSVEGLSLPSLAATEHEVRRRVRELDQAVGDIAGYVSAEIRAPLNMAGAIIGGYHRLKDTMLEPLRAARNYAELGSRSDEQQPTARTSESRQRNKNQQAMNDLIGRAAACACAQMAAETDWESRDEALQAQNITLDLIDQQIKRPEPVPDKVYQAMVDLRLKVSRDLRSRSTALPGLARREFLITLPCVVIAHKLYGDAGREQEIVKRNKIKHPGAVPGGIELEVLSV